MRTIETIVTEVTEQLQLKNDARDRALVESRQVVRHAANAIRALHRADYALAERQLTEGRTMVQTAKHDLEPHPDIYWAGYVQDSQKEFAEACLVAAMIRGTTFPSPEDLGVERSPYLNGMAEAASEMRRFILDSIRLGAPDDMVRAERVLAVMDDVYTSLITVDLPDGVTGGLRRTVDALRPVLERTRGDLTISTRQAALAEALRHAAESRL